MAAANSSLEDSIRRQVITAIMDFDKIPFTILQNGLNSQDDVLQAWSATALGMLLREKANVPPIKANTTESTVWVDVVKALDSNKGLPPSVTQMLRSEGVMPQYYEGHTVATSVYIERIRKGAPGTEWYLVLMLFRNGDAKMAYNFLNCSNRFLSKAASIWAKENNYRIEVSLGVGSDVTWSRQ